MFNILTKNQTEEVKDWLKISNQGESPITYADCHVDPETGEKTPLEIALTIGEDLFSEQCLDYFIQIIPNFDYNGLGEEIKIDEENDENII